MDNASLDRSEVSDAVACLAGALHEARPDGPTNDADRMVTEARGLRAVASEVADELGRVRRDLEALQALIGRPHIGAWVDEVIAEAAHQRRRWGSEHDEGKEPQDWFWLIGFLAGKCLRAHLDGDTEKARHHTVSTAAALAHWAAGIDGIETVMRPGKVFANIKSSEVRMP